MTSIPMDLGNWSHVSKRRPRHQQLLDLALASPGRIFAAVELAEGLRDYADRLASLPPMPVEDLLPKMSVPTVDRWLHYFKHYVLRAQVKDGVLRVSSIRIDLNGNPRKDAAEKRTLLADIQPSRNWTTGKEAA